MKKKKSLDDCFEIFWQTTMYGNAITMDARMNHLPHAFSKHNKKRIKKLFKLLQKGY